MTPGSLREAAKRLSAERDARGPGCGQLAEMGGRSPLPIPQRRGFTHGSTWNICVSGGRWECLPWSGRARRSRHTGGEEASSAGLTLTQADEMHKGALGFFFPRTFGDCVVRNGAHASPKPRPAASASQIISCELLGQRRRRACHLTRAGLWRRK